MKKITLILITFVAFMASANDQLGTPISIQPPTDVQIEMMQEKADAERREELVNASMVEMMLKSAQIGVGLNYSLNAELTKTSTVLEASMDLIQWESFRLGFGCNYFLPLEVDESALSQTALGDLVDENVCFVKVSEVLRDEIGEFVRGFEYGGGTAKTDASAKDIEVFHISAFLQWANPGDKYAQKWSVIYRNYNLNPTLGENEVSTYENSGNKVGVFGINYRIFWKPLN